MLKSVNKNGIRLKEQVKEEEEEEEEGEEEGEEERDLVVKKNNW